MHFHFERNGLLYSLLLVFVIVFIGGIGFWLLEPTVNNWHEGMWLAFTTAATVGYGDVVPTTFLSRALAVTVVLLGFAVLSLVTASIASIFIRRDVVAEEEKIEADLLAEIRALRAVVSALRSALEQQRD